MTTKMAIKSHIGTYDLARRDDFGARGGGRRRGKPFLQRSWKVKLIGRWIEGLHEGSRPPVAQRAGGIIKIVRKK